MRASRISSSVIPFKKQRFNIGWSNLIIEDDDTWKEFNNKSFYFCHSFYLNFLNSDDKKFCKGFIEYNENVPSLIVKKNFVGAQFHPEKSQAIGNKFINKFLNWEPTN